MRDLKGKGMAPVDGAAARQGIDHDAALTPPKGVP